MLILSSFLSPFCLVHFFFSLPFEIVFFFSLPFEIAFFCGAQLKLVEFEFVYFILFLLWFFAHLMLTHCILYTLIVCDFIESGQTSERTSERARSILILIQHFSKTLSHRSIAMRVKWLYSALALHTHGTPVF